VAEAATRFAEEQLNTRYVSKSVKQQLNTELNTQWPAALKPALLLLPGCCSAADAQVRAVLHSCAGHALRLIVGELARHARARSDALPGGVLGSTTHLPGDTTRSSRWQEQEEERDQDRVRVRAPEWPCPKDCLYDPEFVPGASG